MKDWEKNRPVTNHKPKESQMFTVTNINLAKDQTKATKAYADVKAAGLIHKGIRVVSGEKGLFVSMPSQRRRKDGVDVIDPETNQVIYDDHFFPESKEVRDNLTSAVLAAYKAKVLTVEATAVTK
jgi:stage V sporulation protein G